MKIELTDEQEQAVRRGQPVEIVDPETRHTYLLIAREAYEGSRAGPGTDPGPDEEFAVAPGILRSQEAFWRELPELLKTRRNRGKYVAYHRDERFGIARTYEKLLREILRRGIPRNEYDIFVIEPRELPPWEPEEIEPLGPWHFDEDLLPEP